MTAPSSVLPRDVLLRELRVQRLRLQLTLNDLDAVGVALKHGLIDPAEALELMRDMGMDGVVLAERRAA